MGKVKVSNGQETWEIDSKNLQQALSEGFRPTERVIVANSKTQEVFEIDPKNLESAFAEGFSFQDIVKKKQGGGASPGVSKSPSPLPEKTEPADLFTLAKQWKSLKDATSAEKRKPVQAFTSYGDIDLLQKDQAELERVKGQIKELGGDESFAQDVWDIPEGEGFSMREQLPELLKLRQTNKNKYTRELAAIKSKGALFNTIRDAAGKGAAAEEILRQQALEKQDYRSATRNAIALTRKYLGDSGEQQKVIDNIAIDKAYDYGVQPLQDDPRFAQMNPYQQRAMQFLEDVDPAAFNSFSRLLEKDPQQMWLGAKEKDIMLGYEMKSRELENLGMSLMKRGTAERLTELKSKEKLTQEEQAEWDKRMVEYNDLVNDEKNQGQRYPAVAVQDADRFMQEALSANSSTAKRFLLKVGENVDDMVNFWGGILQEGTAAGDLELLGDKEHTASSMTYTPEKDRLIGGNFKTVFSPELQTKIDQLKKLNLDDEQLRDRTRELILENRDQVSAVAVKDPKLSFTGKSVINAVADLGADLLSQAGIAVATGGAGKASQLLSLFTTTFGTAYNDYYNQALQENNPNPGQFALTHTLIEASTELINPDLEAVKKLAGKTTSLGRMLGKLSEADLKAFKPRGFFSNMKKAMLETGEIALKNAGQETVEELAGQLGGNVADKLLFNKDVELTEGLKDTFIQTMVGMLPLGLFSLPFNYNNISRLQKYALYEVGTNKEKFIEAIDKGLAEGLMSPAEADQKKLQIEQIAEAVKKTKTKRNGKPLTDNQKTEAAINRLAQDQLEELKQTAPPDQQAKIAEVEQQLKAAEQAIIPPAAEQQFEINTEEEFEKEITKIIPQKPEPVVLNEEEQAQADYAYKNPYRFFKEKFPGIDIDEYNRLRIQKDKQVKAARAAGLDKMGDAINNIAADNTIEEYNRKANAVLNQLFPNVEVVSYESEDEYIAKEQRPVGSKGMYNPETNRIAFNLERIRKTGALNTIFHEVIHPIVEQVLAKDENALMNFYNEIQAMRGTPGLEAVFEHEDQYAARGGVIQKKEAITEFLAKVADGSIDTSKMSESAITKIIDLINRILKALGVNKTISTASDLKRLSDSITAALQEGNVQGLAETIGKRIEPEAGPAMDALLVTQEDAIKELIKKAGPGVKNDRMKEIIMKAAGISDTDAQALIDAVRNKPPLPPAPPLSSMSPEGKASAYNKFKNLFNQPKYKPPTWWQRSWEKFKNASAWFDNPYRFVSKIVEDIARQYGVDRPSIPIGRIFEKSFAGKAALRVESFIADVVGKGDDRLKGERFDDFQIYMAAMRVVDRLDQDARGKQTGNITRADAEATLETLFNKYGQEGYNDFVRRGVAFRGHMDFMLKEQVASGLLSQEAYDNIKAENDFYAPFSVIQSQMVMDQQQGQVGISGIVKRIKGIGYKIGDISLLKGLKEALEAEQISPEDYFNVAIQVITDALNSGIITQQEAEAHIRTLENPGFGINGIIDAAANMIYKSVGLAQRNIAMQRLYSYKQFDTEGLYIQDVDGFTPITVKGETRMVPKPLNTIKVEPGMGPIKLKVEGKDKIVAVNAYAAKKLTEYNNTEMATWMRVVDFFNKGFRSIVITVSPGFQVVNFAIDFVRSSMLSRYGLLAGKGLVQPLVNAILFVPQYIEGLLNVSISKVGKRTKAYEDWMNSASYSHGMFDNLFDNEKKVREITATKAKRIMQQFMKLKFIAVPGTILEETHKLVAYQRGSSVEGLPSQFFSTQINKAFSKPMNEQQLQDAVDRLNYEVQNFAGSPNFPATHKSLKIASIFLQFFSARVKGEMTDYRRVANLFTTKGEGVKMSASERAKMLAQFGTVLAPIVAYAIMNIADDEDEKEFDSIPPFHQDNYINIPCGKFLYTGKDGVEKEYRDYIKIPLRGLTSTLNVAANRSVKYYKHSNPEEFKKMATNFLGNVSPINLHGNDDMEMGESFVSNLTPVFKWFMEHSFNRDTHSHRDLIPESYGPASMLNRYNRGEMKPWEVATSKTPEWAVTVSKFLYDHLGAEVSAITLDHMENTMGNPTEMYNNAVSKRLVRSKMKYPVYEPRDVSTTQSTTTITPVP